MLQVMLQLLQHKSLFLQHNLRHMQKKQRQEFILAFAKEHGSFKISELLESLSVDRSTAYRDIQALVESQLLITQQKGYYTYNTAHNIEAYFQTAFYERASKQYVFDFLENYIPNQSSFLTAEQKTSLKDACAAITLSTQFFSNNKRLLETILIDLSYSSSYLEGNTYTYLDTEVLIKYKESATDKTDEETQMILNHKEALEFLIENKSNAQLQKDTFFYVHKLLGKGLLEKHMLGIIRQHIVTIGGTTYSPLDNMHQLNEQFELFIRKLNEIVNPFEQAAFIGVFIPYFQLFMDINKRVSRVMMNFPLLKNNLPISSFLQVKKKQYVISLLAIYELNNPTLFCELFVESYMKNITRYV